MAVAAEPAALPVSPGLDEVRALAREHNLVPVRHTFIDDCETPVAAFLKLRGTEPQSPAFLLESAEQGQRVGRYSFIGVRPRGVVRWSLGDDGDPYDLAAREVGRYRQAPLPGPPPPPSPRSPAAPSATSATPSSRPSSRSPSRTPTSSACPTWR